MLLFGLDTATLTLSAALVERSAEGDRLLDRRAVAPPTPHSSVLPAIVQQMLEAAGKVPSDLSAVVIGLGPGSFTGLRISLATAKGICYAASIPLAGGSSLAAMALAAAAGMPEGALLVPCLDARKGEVYCGFFRVQGGSVVGEGPEVAIGPEALVEKLQAHPGARVFGIGREAYPALAALPPPGTEVRTPDAFALVTLARELPAFSKQAVFGLEPHYVRPSDAEWTAKPKKAK
jgi:tRNA threonylcarbamoyladenosine biosynthesis protein TsaB